MMYQHIANLLNRRRSSPDLAARSIADKSLFLNTGQLGIFMKLSSQFITYGSPIMLSAVLSACGGGQSTLEPSAATVAPPVAMSKADTDSAAGKTGRAATGRSTGLEEGGAAVQLTPVRRRGGWQDVQPVQSNAGYQHRIATDDAGNAILVFTAADEFGYQSLYAKLYSEKTKSWSKGIALEDMPQNVVGLLLASNESGEAVVTWTQNKQVFSTRFDPKTQTFDAAQRVDNLPGEAAATCSALDKKGNATVVFLNTPTSNAPGNVYHNDLYAVRNNAKTGTWETSSKKLELLPGAVFGAKCAVDDAGRVTVVWTQTKKHVGPAEAVEEIDPVTGNVVINYVSPVLGYTQAIYYNQYDETRNGNVGPWHTAHSPVTGQLSEGNHFLHDLAYNAKGDLLLTYVNSLGLNVIGAPDDENRGGFVGWTLYGLGQIEANARQSRAGLDKDGNALLLWESNGGLRTMRFIRDSNSASFGWSTIEALAVSGGTIGNSTGLSLSMNPDGKALLAYNGGPISTYAHTYDLTSNGWSAAQYMGGSVNSAIDTGTVRTSINSKGTGVVAWEHDDTIYTSFYLGM
jgi:hypothetical protein